jgi:hypothetical protein
VRCLEKRKYTYNLKSGENVPRKKEKEKERKKRDISKSFENWKQQ